MKPVHIYCPVYRRNIYSFFKWSQQDFENYMRKNFKISFAGLDDLSGATRVIQKGDQTILILWVRKSNRIEEIAALTHEAIHVSNFIFKDADVLIDTENDEPQAYHVSMIVRWALKGSM